MSANCRRVLRQALRSACGAAALLAVTVSLGIASPHQGPEAPVGTVDGRIVRSDGPKFDVHVYDQSTWKTVTTRSGDMFRLEGLAAGDHVLRIVSDYCEVQLIPVTVRAGAVTDVVIELACQPRPCSRPDRADPTCILTDSEQRRRVGTFCEVHRGTKLKLDLVPIKYGIAAYTPGLGGDERKKFPNARPWSSAGCVDSGQRWAEVAYCWNCRAAWQVQSALSRLRPVRRDR